MNLPNKLDYLTPKDFPMFVTVKKLLYMIDGSL